jgi:hypothetical protein
MNYLKDFPELYWPEVEVSTQCTIISWQLFSLTSKKGDSLKVVQNLIKLLHSKGLPHLHRLKPDLLCTIQAIGFVGHGFIDLFLAFV